MFSMFVFWRRVARTHVERLWKVVWEIEGGRKRSKRIQFSTHDLLIEQMQIPQRASFRPLLVRLFSRSCISLAVALGLVHPRTRSPSSTRTVSQGSTSYAEK